MTAADRQASCKDCELCGGTTLLRERCTSCSGFGDTYHPDGDRECTECDGEGSYDAPCSFCAVWASELAQPACDASQHHDVENDTTLAQCEQYVCPHCMAALCPPRPPVQGRAARCPRCDGIFSFDGAVLVAAGKRIGDHVFFGATELLGDG